MLANFYKPEDLINRLNSIANSLASKPDSLALIGLGSAGLEINRLDQYSDLDFFVIVRKDKKQNYLSNLSWLEADQSLVFKFMNTVDGFKALYADGIFLEFAVFEEWELKKIPYSSGRVVWAHPDFDLEFANPQIKLPEQKQPPIEWSVNEALAICYIGINRYLRGEKLSAFRFVQIYAVDRVMELAKYLEKDTLDSFDPFSNERRFEKRFPQTAKILPDLMTGYENTPDAVLAILNFLDENFDVNEPLKNLIKNLVFSSKKDS